jgi:hypothetical protein
VFTNSIMTTCVKMTTNWHPISLIVVEGYKSTNAKNLWGRYWEPYIVTTEIPNHINGHFIRPNMVAFKYLDFKKDVDPNVHVKVFNFAMNVNAKTSKQYISMHSTIC